MRKLLMVFTKNPEKGKVKTRLAKTIGDDAALEVYIRLLNHTKKFVGESNSDKAVFYSQEITGNDDWSAMGCQQVLQHPGDLGDRMKAAFDYAFAKEYQQVIIVGSDCPEVNSEIISEAFDALTHNDIVIGPAEDGGYYLLGMNQMHACFFENKSWSQEALFTETMHDVVKHKLKTQILKTCNDIDTIDDYEALKHLF